MDALLGNFDRHGANWGFIKEDNKYTIAPIFDNGSCLFPNLVDEEEMKEIMKFPTFQVKLNGRKSSYFEVINSLQFEECNETLRLLKDLESVHQLF